MRTLTALSLCTVAVAVAAPVALAQAPWRAEFRPSVLEPAWERTYDHGIIGHDALAALDVAPHGEIYAVGSSLGLVGRYSYEIVTLKYAADGTLLWERRYDTPGNGFDDIAVDVEVSVSGNVIVLGQGPGTNGNQDVITLCYDAFGTLQWSAIFDNNWSDGATALATAPDGSIYVLAGTYFAATVSDVVLLKYDALGVLQWSRFFDGGWGTDVGVGLGLDPAGDVLIGGYSIEAPGGTNFDWLALKYDSSGTLQWSAKRAGAASGWPDYCWACSTDAAGDLLMTGYLVNTSSVQDFTTMKFDNDGQLRWSRTLGNATGGGQAVTADRDGNVFAAGGVQLVSYDALGALRWHSAFGAPGLLSGNAQAIACDPAGRVVVAGTGFHPLSGAQFLTVAYGVHGRAADFDLRAGGPAPRALLAPAPRRVYTCGARSNGHDNDGLLVRFALIP